MLKFFKGPGLAIVLLLCITLLFSIAGCNSARSQKNDGYNDPFEDYNGINENSDEKNADDDTSKDPGGALYGRKVIKSAEIYIETLDYDKSLAAVNKLIHEFGGYIQDSQTKVHQTYNSNSLRRASYIIRIPADKLDDFVNKSGSIGNVINQNIKGEDITEKYFDTEARVNTLKVQEERLLDMLKSAKNLQELLDLEERLNDIRYEIEQLTGNIKKWDSLVELSTVRIEITEVTKISEPKPSSFGDQISSTFSGSIKALGISLKGIVIFLTAVLPFLVTLGVPAIVIIILVKRLKRKNPDKNPTKIFRA